MHRRAALRFGAPALAAVLLAAPAFGALTRLAPAEFDRQRALAEEIDVGALDRALLAAAVFHETNRVRARLGLKWFEPLEQLDDAAETQATIGALFRPPSHTNPFPLIATPLDRVRQAGLNPAQVAENIALLPVYDAPHGTGFYRLKDDPRLRHAKTGELLPRHTYRSIAVAVVAAWMNSPGHRANIVEPALTHLGCAVRQAKSLSDIDLIFFVQVFSTPEKRPRRGR
jgi:uncharacterized protein YkwD